MITGPQFRAARTLLGWTIADLSDRSRLSKSLIQRVETSPGVPAVRAENLSRLQRTLEEAGAVLSENRAEDPAQAGPRARASCA
jgi:transcriptional regulator with XRE-family HTH domain